MRQCTISRVSLAAGVVLFASACSDTTQPTPPSEPQLGFDPVQQADDPVALVRGIPDFGGFFFDGEGTPTVYLRDASALAEVARALGPWLDTQGLRGKALRVRRADFDWASLERWQVQAGREVLAMRGAVWVDADEARNRVTIGVERGTAAAQVQSAVARLGVPSTAMLIEEVEPVTLAATLRERVRPVVGGLQIHFAAFLCTLGFNAVRNGARSFITASHCTEVQGGTEGTPYWQPHQSVAPGLIAIEAADPVYSTGGACPSGRRCRRSDAARAAYRSGTSSTLGSIARTTGANNGSVTISGRFTITAEGSATVGQMVHKVGRTTGWTRGAVTRTCAHVNVLETNITLFCQSLVSAGVDLGDSGSPVFRRQGTGSNVRLVGILWGSTGSGEYVFSPMANIEAELGALRTF